MPHGNHMFNTESDMNMSKCVHIHHQNIHDHTGNVCFGVMHIVHVLIYQIQN